MNDISEQGAPQGSSPIAEKSIETSGGVATLRIWAPVLDSATWSCRFTISRPGEETIAATARGRDSFEALMFAAADGSAGIKSVDGDVPGSTGLLVTRKSANGDLVSSFVHRAS
ncbi:DUF6968 family protein [Tsukamurella paurometabola]